MSATQSAVQAAFSNAVVLSNEQCNVNKLLDFSEPLKAGIRFHTLITIVGAVCAILCCLISGFLILGHLLNWVNPPEQRQLVRVIFILPVFALCSFFSVWFYNAEGFLNPIPQIVEAFGIVALFYFYVTCVTPNETLREQFYDNLERKKLSRAKGCQKHPNGSLRWFHVLWIMVFQLILGRIATTVASEYIQATRCPLSKRLRRGTLIISLIQSVQTIIAVIAVIRYERRMRPHLHGHRALSKLISFKLIVFIDLVQTLIFKGLGSSFVLKPTAHISYRDITVGTPQFMLCGEMFLFSLAFLWSYPFSPYRQRARDQPGDRRTLARGVADVVNIMDIFHGVGFLGQAILPENLGKRYIAQDEARRTGNKGLGAVASTDSNVAGAQP